MPSYDEQLQLVEFGDYKSLWNIKYNIGSLKTHGATMGQDFVQVFDICDGIPTGVMSYGLTPSTYEVEHYYPQTGDVQFERVSCFHFENFVIKVNNNVSSEKIYLKYYKLQKYSDIINKIPNASKSPGADDKSYRFVYTTQKLSDVDTFTLDGYYGVNGWELLILTNIDVSNTYRFKKKPDDEYTQLINKEYYELTTKTKNLEQMGSDPIINLKTENELYKIKFPGFYVQNQSFIRFANYLTSDTTQYKLTNNKDINNIEVLPQNSDNLGYEDLSSNELILFDGLNNNYELRDFQKNNTSITIYYKDLNDNKNKTLEYQIRPSDKVYIVKRQQSTVNYSSTNVFETCARSGEYKVDHWGSNWNAPPKLNSFMYTFAIMDTYLYKMPRICFTGPTVESHNKLDLKIDTPDLLGTYMESRGLESLNFSAIDTKHLSLFQKVAFDNYSVDNIRWTNGDTAYLVNNRKIKRLESIIQTSNISTTHMNTGAAYSFWTYAININMNGGYFWNIKKKTIPYSKFEVESFSQNSGMKIINTIDNKPGLLPNYINLLSQVDTNVTVYDYWNGATLSKMKDYDITVSSDFNQPLGTINGNNYDLKQTSEFNTSKSNYLRFGFESKINMPSEGYIIFLELDKSN